MSLRKSLLGAVAAVGLLAAAGSAQASVIATLQGVVAEVGTPGVFDYTYNATLAANEQIVKGSYLTLYDFGAVVGSLPKSTTGLMTTTNFAYSQALTGPTPPLTAPVDSPTVLNVTATYNGAAGTLTGASLGDGAAGNLGTFTVASANGSTKTGSQGSSAQKFGGPTTGDQDSNVTTAEVPSQTAVPEPASLALLGAGLFGAGLIRRRRKNG